jgi:hypothetical protein
VEPFGILKGDKKALLHYPSTAIELGKRIQPTTALVPPLFLLDFCLLAARLSNCSICFSISFSLRFIPAIMFA